MDIQESKEPKDRDYFKILQETHPHLKRFLHVDIPGRFRRSKTTNCDGLICIKQINIKQANLFVGPGPDYKPYLLCYDCLQSEYRKVAESGEYDIHERHLLKIPRKQP
jgi:hypothetical protein